MGRRLQNVEDATEIVVGKYYLVPVVCVSPDVSVLRRVPVVGPLHEDSKFIGFPDYHYHPDRRFVSQAWLDYYGTGTYSTGMAAGGQGGHWAAVYAYVITDRLTGLERCTSMFDLGRKRMQCKRIVEPFRKDAPWIQKLEQAYAGERLREGMICPHRGISCRGVKINDEKCVVCPGHGLQFNVESGHLVSRSGQDLQMPLIK